MSDGARCHYCRKVPCVCDSTPRPTRAEAEAITSQPTEIGNIHIKRYAAAYMALLDENEALAKTLERVRDAKDLYSEMSPYADLVCSVEDVLAEYAKRKQEDLAK